MNHLVLLENFLTSIQILGFSCSLCSNSFIKMSVSSHLITRLYSGCSSEMYMACQINLILYQILHVDHVVLYGGGPRVVVSTAAFHARVRGSFPGLGGLKETKLFLRHPLVKLSIVGILCDREVSCSASDLHSLNFESCVWRAVSSHSSYHLQEVSPGPI